MSIFEYDQEKHMRQEREAAWKEGRRSGLEEGREQILESLIRKKGVAIDWDPETISRSEASRLIDGLLKG